MEHTELDAPSRIEPDDDLELGDLHGRVGYGRYARYTPAALGLALVLIVAAIGWYQWRPSDDLPRVGALVDQAAPEFTLTLLDGSTINSRDLQGTALALNFWASWCEPCKTEMPALDQVAADLRAEGVNAKIIGIGTKRDNDENAKALVADLGLTYAIGRDTAGPDPVRGPVTRAFGIDSYPATVFIRPDGTVFSVRFGPLSAEEGRRYIDETLK